jgi:hypothetical protein
VRQIRLTKGQIAIVDDADYDWLSQWKWHAHPTACTIYAVRTKITKGVKYKIWMHRAINETPVELFTDHMDGNGLNNKRSNLRSVSHRENGLNRAKWQKGTASQHRGVYLDTRDGLWFSSITVNDKQIYLGRFMSIDDASKAYQEARKLLVPEAFTRKEELI